MGSEAPAVGIDLGTTYSCIAYYRDDKMQVIKKGLNKNITASVVAFSRDDFFQVEPQKTVSAIKNLIGRDYDDPVVQQWNKYSLYEIVNQYGKPHVKILHNGEKLLFTPEELSAMILRQLKKDATKYFQKEVTKAVITVPAHFNDAQRQATRRAGKIAGLEVLKIINEPAAAALAYGVHQKYKNQANKSIFLVYDFGSESFSATIISIKYGIFEVIATNGLSQLGGDDIDEMLTLHFARQFERKHNIDITDNRRAMGRLRAQSKDIKMKLSEVDECTLILDCLYKMKDIECTITRDTFNEVNHKIFQQTLDCVVKTLKEAKIHKSDVDEILLVGGSSRIPGIRKMLTDHFGKEPNASLHPDEAVALGAAVEAAILEEDTSIGIDGLLLMNVCPHSLGVQVDGGLMSVIIPRYSPLPVEKIQRYATTKDNQTFANIIVYEGEGALLTKIDFLIKGIPKARKHEVKFDVKFMVDVDGILHVTATEIKNGVGVELQVEYKTRHLSDDDVMTKLDKAKRYKQQDEEKILFAKNDLEDYCYELEVKVQKWYLSSEEKKAVLEACQSSLDYIKGTKVTEEECINMKMSLRRLNDKTFR